ncbi:Gfo/Idh/MocA family oxidoreductase [Bacillus sp. NEB1478]|uniref:Gfo/Idh/MocA family protein n=1 Tax=Bacillus sp. NEB1478 TaxID=3073816 RepID=UPI0028732507|nr:Gfo/Idh/MocA family oxidoreductase [Bacillus sp. NEB1478]WNB92637.1 Gfo/Idh/MocA family oxidoreductase [Bacillus sp. NEB1478]
MTTEFRFGIIGCGVISHTHAEEISKIKGAKLVAVADVVEDCAKSVAQTYGVDWYSDYLELLKRDDIDIVNILTPSGMRAEVVIEAARHGKHIIAEKPIDVTYEKATSMIQACRDAGVKLAVISQHRFDMSTVKVKKSIEEGKFGRLVLGECAVNWYRTQGYYDSGAWRGTWAMDGGGALMNQSIHTIDLLQYLVGPVDSVFAHTATLAHERIEVEDVAVSTVKFKNGALGTIVGTTSAFPGLSARLEVFGTNGSAVIEHDKLTHLFVKSKDPEEQINNLAEKDLDAHDPSTVFGYAHRLQIEDMMHAIREDREPLVNGEEGLKPLEIILAIYESAKTGKEIKLPYKTVEANR